MRHPFELAPGGFAQPVKANVLFFTMLVKTVRSKMETGAGVAQLASDLGNSIPKRFERLERFEPNLVGWLAALVLLERLF
jgi:hypothetical protein